MVQSFPPKLAALGDVARSVFSATVGDLENFPPSGAGQLFVRRFHGVPRVMAT
jgi:hypothetical protein